MVPSVTEPGPADRAGRRQQRLDEGGLAGAGVTDQHHVSYPAGVAHRRHGAGDPLVLVLLRHRAPPCYRFSCETPHVHSLLKPIPHPNGGPTQPHPETFPKLYVIDPARVAHRASEATVDRVVSAPWRRSSAECEPRSARSSTRRPGAAARRGHARRGHRRRHRRHPRRVGARRVRPPPHRRRSSRRSRRSPTSSTARWPAPAARRAGSARSSTRRIDRVADGAIFASLALVGRQGRRLARGVRGAARAGHQPGHLVRAGEGRVARAHRQRRLVERPERLLAHRRRRAVAPGSAGPPGMYIVLWVLGVLSVVTSASGSSHVYRQTREPAPSGHGVQLQPGLGGERPSMGSAAGLAGGAGPAAAQRVTWPVFARPPRPSPPGGAAGRAAPGRQPAPGGRPGDARQRHLDALVRRAMRSYARYWQEAFRLPSLHAGADARTGSSSTARSTWPRRVADRHGRGDRAAARRQLGRRRRVGRRARAGRSPPSPSG